MKLQLASAILSLAGIRVDAGVKNPSTKMPGQTVKVLETSVSFMDVVQGSDLCFDTASFCTMITEVYAFASLNTDTGGLDSVSLAAAAGFSAASGALCDVAEAALAEFTACFEVDATFQVTKEPDGDVSRINLDTSLFASTAVLVSANATADVFGVAVADSGTSSVVANVDEFCDDPDEAFSEFESFICEGQAFSNAFGEANATSVGTAYSTAAANSTVGASTVISVRGKNIKYFEAAFSVVAESYSFAYSDSYASAIAAIYVEAFSESFVELCEVELVELCEACGAECEADCYSFDCAEAFATASADAESIAEAFAEAIAEAFSRISLEFNTLAIFKQKHGEDLLAFGIEGEPISKAVATTFCLNTP